MLRDSRDVILAMLVWGCTSLNAIRFGDRGKGLSWKRLRLKRKVTLHTFSLFPLFVASKHGVIKCCQQRDRVSGIVNDDALRPNHQPVYDGKCEHVLGDECVERNCEVRGGRHAVA